MEDVDRIFRPSGLPVIDKIQMRKHMTGFHMTDREAHFHMRLITARFNHGN